MKNRNSIYQGLSRASIGMLAACMTLTACDKDQEFTPAMPEAKLINGITFKVSENLPLAIGMDSTIVFAIDAPEELEDRSIIWKSTDETVAKVSQQGTITGIAEGTAIISVTPAIGFGPSASVTVNVIPEIIKATDMTLVNPKEGEDIYETDRIQLEASILPANHTYSYLTWASSNPSIATVSENGLVNCLTPGKAIITAYTHDRSGVSASYELNIKEYIPVESVSISALTEPLCISRGPVQLDVAYTPTNATTGSVDWTSSDENIATVDLGVVTPKGFGTATITATCKATGQTASVSVTVESGWVIWDGQNNFDGWKIEQNYSSYVIENGKMVVTAGAQNATMRRADLSFKNVPINLDFSNYPILAMRSTLPVGGKGIGQGGAYTLDLVTKSGNINKAHVGELLSDNTNLIYYDIPSINAALGNGMVEANTFQIKVADIYNENLPTSQYTVYWIRTFKSIAEAKAFAEAEISAGN